MGNAADVGPAGPMNAPNAHLRRRLNDLRRGAESRSPMRPHLRRLTPSQADERGRGRDVRGAGPRGPLRPVAAARAVGDRHLRRPHARPHVERGRARHRPGPRDRAALPADARRPGLRAQRLAVLQPELPYSSSATPTCPASPCPRCPSRTWRRWWPRRTIDSMRRELLRTARSIEDDLAGGQADARSPASLSRRPGESQTSASSSSSTCWATLSAALAAGTPA